MHQPIYIWLQGSSSPQTGYGQGTAERLNPQIRSQQQLLEVFVLHSNQGDDCRLWPHHCSWDCELEMLGNGTDWGTGSCKELDSW